MGGIGHTNGLAKTVRFDDREHRAENFFLRETMMRLDLGEHCRPNEIPGPIYDRLRKEPAFLRTDGKILFDAGLCPSVDDWADLRTWLGRIADGQTEHRIP